MPIGMGGLFNSDRVVNPGDFQGLSEGNLADAGQSYRDMNRVGDALGTGGASMANLGSRLMYPMVNKLVAEANYRPERANQAGIDAQLQAENARGAYERNMSRMGVNPNSGRFAGLGQRWALALAAAKSGAMTRAERAEREGMYGRLMNAASVGGALQGRGLQGMQTGLGALQGAAGGMRQIAGDYGSLASGKQQDSEVQRGIQEAESGQSSFQSLIDRLFPQEKWSSSAGITQRGRTMAQVGRNQAYMGGYYR